MKSDKPLGISIRHISDPDWSKELEILLQQSDGLGIEPDLSSMTREELYGVYVWLKRSRSHAG